MKTRGVHREEAPCSNYALALFDSSGTAIPGYAN